MLVKQYLFRVRRRTSVSTGPSRFMACTVSIYISNVIWTTVNELNGKKNLSGLTVKAWNHVTFSYRSESGFDTASDCIIEIATN